MESKKEKFDAFNVCTGKETTVNGLADTVISLFGASSKALGVKVRVTGQHYLLLGSQLMCSVAQVKHGPARDGDIKKSVCNPAKAKESLGFTYQYEVKEGLAATRDWFQNKK